MNKENPVGWFEIYVDDMERAQQFYETVFNTKLEKMPMPESAGQNMQMFAFPMNMEEVGRIPGALVQMEGMKAGGNGTVVYFSSEDAAIEEARVESAGGKVLQSKMDIGEFGFAAMATDTEGNVFGIHSMK